MARQAPNVLAHAAARRRGRRRRLRRRGRSRTRSTRRCATGARTSRRRTTCSAPRSGPHPYPTMVRDFHRVIGREARAQFRAARGPRPARRGRVRRRRIERDRPLPGVPRRRASSSSASRRAAAGRRPGDHAARFRGRIARRSPRHAHDRSCRTRGADRATHSVSAGLDYPAVGPRARAASRTSAASSIASVSDDEALAAFEALSRDRGDRARARERARARVRAEARDDDAGSGAAILVNLSGRGDKDLEEYERHGGSARS